MSFRSFLSFAFAIFVQAGLSAAILPLTPESIVPLPAGSSAPSPVLIGADGKEFDLASAFADKSTILIFYRGGWCPFCNRHLAALAEIEIDLRALGFQLIGVTPDSPDQLTATAKESKARYRLLSDRAMKAAGAYGIAYRLPAEAGENYRKNGIVLPRAPDGDGFWQPVPAAFIISRDGVVRFVYSNPDPENAIDARKLLAAAKSATAH